MKLYARPEAIAHYWQALELLDRLPATAERKRLHIDALALARGRSRAGGAMTGSGRQASSTSSGP